MGHEQETQDPDQLTVLVVDDHLEVRVVLGRWLSNAGYLVLSAPDALEVLAICDECVIDIAICDVRMETHDGTWLARQLGTRSPSTRLIFATAV